ncbi:hypothetical protein DUNSADRAFT_1437, partial [Dunaliella salina]
LSGACLASLSMPEPPAPSSSLVLWLINHHYLLLPSFACSGSRSCQGLASPGCPSQSLWRPVYDPPMTHLSSCGGNAVVKLWHKSEGKWAQAMTF